VCKFSFRGGAALIARAKVLFHAEIQRKPWILSFPQDRLADFGSIPKCECKQKLTFDIMLRKLVLSEQQITPNGGR